MLCHIYHHALHNDFHTARDMLLMSHLQESIHSADVATQILYNRTVVQLGLCAFRSGLIKEAQATLQDIFTTQRVKELLAQGVHQQRFQVLTPEQEKAEKQRQLPFHMHINTELLEAAFLVSSMLVEIPLLASIDSDELRRKAISKPFRRLLDFADRQVFTGPPESTRDHIMQASKALQDGEWEQCRDLIQSIKIWSLMPEAAAVKEMLAKYVLVVLVVCPKDLQNIQTNTRARLAHVPFHVCSTLQHTLTISSISDLLPPSSDCDIYCLQDDLERGTLRLT
jgi:translation initiation factor 3 subunit C